MTRDSEKSTVPGSPASSVYQKAKYSSSDNAIDRSLVEIAKKDIIFEIREDNPLEMAGDTIGDMRGGVTKLELDEALNAAAKELAEEVGLEDFPDSEVFRAGDREMINDAKRSMGAYRYHDDPLADVMEDLEDLHEGASKFEREEALRIARKEYEFQKRVKERYDLIRSAGPNPGHKGDPAQFS